MYSTGEQGRGRWSKYKCPCFESIINQVSYIKKGSSKLDRADDALVGCLQTCLLWAIF